MANDVTRHPYGPGSHAPLADVREMPACYPIKGNFDSMLYHRPDSQNYGATIAEVWFDSPSAAEAAAFVLAPRHSKDQVTADYEPGGARHPCSIAAVEENRNAAERCNSGPATGLDDADPAWADDAGERIPGAASSGAAVVAGAAGPAVGFAAESRAELDDAAEFDDMVDASTSDNDTSTSDNDTSTGDEIDGPADPDGGRGGLLGRLPKWLLWPILALLAVLFLSWLLSRT